MKQDTRQKLIETGARIIHRNGYNNTGIQEILRAADVPKGSFYFYFQSKEDFGLHIIDYFDNVYMQMIGPVISDSKVSPLKRIENVLDFFIGFFAELNFTCGCPIGNLSQEMADLSDEFGKRLEKSIELITGVYLNLLSEAKKTGEIDNDIDISDAAEFILSSWHGALIKMKVCKNTRPLQQHKQFVMKLLSP